MTTAQRKYLISKIEDQYTKEIKELDEQLGEEPTIQSYVTKAILDGSIKLKPQKDIIQGMKHYVGEKGQSHVIDSDWRSGKRKTKAHTGFKRSGSSEDDEYNYTIRVPLEVMFEVPEKLLRAQQNYEKKREDIERQKSVLLAKKDTLVLQINIGSNAILDPIVAEVDALGSLSLFQERMDLLTASMKPDANNKMVGNGKQQKRLNASGK